MSAQETCGETVYWWDGEYEEQCELPPDHEGDHYDGAFWFDDDNGCVDHLHPEPERVPAGPKLVRHELYRRSDGQLVACHLVAKGLTLAYTPPSWWPDWPHGYEWRVSDVEVGATAPSANSPSC